MNKLTYIFILCVLFSPTSLACSCKIKSVEESFSDSKAVLLIEVQSLEVIREADSNQKSGSIKYLEAKFITVESFKGAAEPIKVLRTYSNCGVELYPSQKYLVYVPKESVAENFVSQCHGSFQYLPQLEHSQSLLDDVRGYSRNE